MSAYYNDIDPYCCRVLRKNIALGNLPGGYVDERDIRDVRASDLVGYQHIHLFAGIGGFPLGLKWANFPESIKVLTGGFPCQDISVAGKRAGITGSRSGLWSEMYRLICELRPHFIIVENVAALLHGGIDRILGDLAAGGYDAEWQVLSAESIGAPHLRERIYIVAYPQRLTSKQRYQPDMQRGWTQETKQTGMGSGYVSDSQRKRCNGLEDATTRNDDHGKATRWQEGASGIEQCSQDVSYPDRQSLAVGQVFGSYARQELATLKRSCSTGAGQWAIESSVGRLVNGVPHRVEQLRGYGNSIVPQLAQIVALCILAAIEREGVPA